MGGSGQGGMQMSAAQQMQHQQMVRNQALSGSPVSQMQMLSQQQSLGLQQTAPLPNAQGLTNATQVSDSLFSYHWRLYVQLNFFKILLFYKTSRLEKMVHCTHIWNLKI